MANGIAIGGFAQGLSDGLKSGLSFGKAMREKEAFELEKPELELKAEIAKRKKLAQTQANEQFSAWKQSNLFDPNGNPLPDDQRPSDLMIQQAYFNLLTKAELDNQAVDPESFAKRQQMGQALKQEGIMKAIDTWLKTGDAGQTLKVFNSSGQSKAPEGTTFKTVTDAMGNQDVAIVGPDGKMLGTFNQALFFMSADNVARNYGDSKRTIFEQGQANKRAAISAQTQRDIAELNSRASMDRLLVENENRVAVKLLDNQLKGADDPIGKEVKAAVMDFAGKFAGNAGFAQDPILFMERMNTVAGLTRKFMQEAKNSGQNLDANTAAAMAINQLGYYKNTDGNIKQ